MVTSRDPKVAAVFRKANIAAIINGDREKFNSDVTYLARS